MALIDKLKPHYIIKVLCKNCEKKCEVRIKKGVTVAEAIKDKQLKCDNCKCIIIPTEYTTVWSR